MPTGEVGGGHQNRYETEGTIFQKHPAPAKTLPQPLLFKKGNVTDNTNRNENECWTAGTPVQWNGDLREAKAITAVVQGINMLVSTDENGKITEYHPLITFFNEVMARIMQDGHKKLLNGLTKEDTAVKLWQYLDKEYGPLSELPKKK